MKIASYFFIGLFVLSLASCSSDDDSGPDDGNNSQEGTLLGEWNVSKATMEGSFSESGVNVTMNAVANEMAGNDVTFFADNTLTGNSAPFEMVIESVVNGQSFTETQTASEALPIEGEWSREGDSLYLQEDGSESIEYTINTLSATTLIISSDLNSAGFGGDNVPEDAQFTVTLTLTRA